MLGSRSASFSALVFFFAGFWFSSLLESCTTMGSGQRGSTYYLADLVDFWRAEYELNSSLRERMDEEKVEI